MHFASLAALAALVATVPFVRGHDGPSMPQIIGLDPKDLKARDVLSSIGARFAGAHEVARRQGQKLGQRQDKRCGAGLGSCPAGQCCSPEGNCGTDAYSCFSPGCQYAYGPGCPENQTPAGTNTSSIARTKIGSIPYGGDGVYNCITPKTIALTFDDGPMKDYTAHILDILKKYNARATFFITGNNLSKGQIDKTQEYIDVIKRMDSEGHQIASHTWTHLDLSLISQIDRKQQMWKNEMALRNIVGKIPTYMRPPYSSCVGQCETDMANLGYHVIYFDVDTDDYDQDSPNLIQNSKKWFLGNITQSTAAKGAKWLEISHDIHQQTAYNLTDYMLSTLTSLGYTPVTVGECLGDPAANWYRTGAGTPVVSSSAAAVSSSAPAASATGTKKVTPDATCGGTNGYTCTGSIFGNCCSAAGWCGSDTAYCGTGCQTAFGTCPGTGASSPVPSSVVRVSSTRAASSSTKHTSNTKKTTSTAPSKISSSSKAASATATSSKKVSPDATCGGKNGYTCAGSQWGNCCSQNGWCGSTAAYCGTGCNTLYGTCT